MAVPTPSTNKFRISRRGRKLQISDDQRTLVALPKDVPERTWAEILQKEENDLIIFDIREEILENALKIGYDKYMEKQTTIFTVHCATQAWLKLIDWHFYRHDPGEDPSAYPPCYIPRRAESWIPDSLPEPSPKDTWTHQKLDVNEEASSARLQKWPSSSSLDLPVIEEIPSKYWFPGKVNLPYVKLTSKKQAEPKKSTEERRYDKLVSRYASFTSKSEMLMQAQDSTTESQRSTEEYLNTESEVVQKVTDYSTDEFITEKESSYGEIKNTTPVDGSLHGAGDSTVLRPKKRMSEKSKSFMRGRSRSRVLPPIDIGGSRSRISIISDCRLRNLRLDTQCEISSEKMDTPTGEIIKRK